MLVEFRYEYQGQRYQGPKAEDARWSDLPELSSFRMKNVAAIRWLAANLSEAADAIERGAKYQQVSEMFRDAER